MPIRIADIEENSIAEQAGFIPGDVITEINGEPVRDSLDYQYVSSEENLEYLIRRSGEVHVMQIRRTAGNHIGIVLENTRFKHCANKCIFCFIDQNPPHLRPALYFKDEDFRLSFMYGNYITLTNIKQQELERIVHQQLSPMYISIHVLEPEIRKYMLGISWEDNVIDKMRFLIDGGITLHGQIVLCPTINDGSILKDTVFGLLPLVPGLKTLSIVPVGLTKHRDGLPALQPVTPAVAEETIQRVASWQKIIHRQTGIRFVYASDELYCMAGIDFPALETYAECEQLENGVGMCRKFLEDIPIVAGEFPRRLQRPKRMTLVTGALATPLLQNHLLPKLMQIENLDIQLVTVRNQFYGEAVTVSGLLSGGDIINTLQSATVGDCVYLPPDILNSDGLFLDQMSFDTFQRKIQVPVIVYPGHFHSIFDDGE